MPPKLSLQKKIGFTCAYTPLPLIDAAGFVPYRILPMTNAPDLAGQLMHDNMCPHVKKIIDRALGADIPSLEGVIFMNSCDAMRRACDAWGKIKPEQQVMSVDLPPISNERSHQFFAEQLQQLARDLSGLSGQVITADKLQTSCAKYEKLFEMMQKIRVLVSQGQFAGGSPALQELYNTLVTESLDITLPLVENLLMRAQATPQSTADKKIPLFIFGNVIPDPEVFALFESCGARLVADDLCTGSRVFNKLNFNPSANNLFLELATSLLNRTPCARTIDPHNPDRLAQNILAEAKKWEVKGVIGYTVKFCDPYLAKLPRIREVLRDEGMPHLLLEGDCTTRSLGQQRTRIEAFIEMLG
ncbi:MAG: hypothetical protein ACD_73C00718G0002 [uncultured bacterium]|nr:MAG: hypothetical protein ACD_73C00718G0002 [uncultured bacterium]